MEDFFIEINKSYFVENIKTIQKITNVKIAPVIKSNAYGHGSYEIISLLKNIQTINYICVAYEKEAEKAILDGWEKKIIIMSPSFNVICDNNNFEYFLFSFDFLEYLLEQAKNKKKNIRVHIKLNLGLNRLGFNLEETNLLIDCLIKNKNYITVVGVCMHCPRLNFTMTDELNKQLKQFTNFIKKVLPIFPNILIHPFGSKGINLIQKYNINCNFIRVGGALYGLLSHLQQKTINQDFPKLALKQILTLKTKITQIRKIRYGEYIGYGSLYQAKKDTIVALVNFGYGFGYNNQLTKAHFAGEIKGILFPIIGLICMNNIFFDITEHQSLVAINDTIILTSHFPIELQAAELSYQYLGGREYYFTSLLSYLIPKIII